MSRFVRVLIVSLLAVPLQLHATEGRVDPGFRAGPTAGADLPTAQQQGTITGRIVDSQTLQPIASAQVYISELNLGVLSRADGSYLLINVPSGSHTVRVQVLGFRTETRPVTVVAGQSLSLDVQLSREVLALDEVVVTGTAGGTQRRAIGNVVERVNVSRVLETAPVTSVEQVLSGKTPGLTMVGDPGTVGGGGQIRIRGSSSVALSGDPIIYIDGVRMNSERGEVGRHTAVSRLNDIDPRDIESIEVIKGPAAATLYGTEAANGVIQIITKRGVQGAPTFDASLELGASWLPLNYITGGYFPRPGAPPIAQRTMDDLVYINLYEEELKRGNKIFDYGPIQRYGVSVRGGNELLMYSASLNRSDQDGVTDWNWDTRNSARVSMTLAASNALKITANTAYMTGENSMQGDSFFGTNFGWGARLNTALIEGHPDRGFSQPPEYNSLDVGSDILETRRTNWSLEFRHEPNSWLTHRLVAGIDDFQQKRSQLVYVDPEMGQRLAAARDGLKRVTAVEAPVATVDFSGTVKFRPMEQLGAATSYGLQYYNKKNFMTQAQGTHFATRALSTVGAAARYEADETQIENTTVGVYLQQQVDWNNRIFLTGAVRADDNSAFGADFDIAIYPKLSATWVVHEEPFWQNLNLPLISQFRLRGAWGAAGQQPDAFAAARLYQPVTGPNGQAALTPRTYGNPELGPERGEELEVGFDADFLDGRVSLAVTRYDRVTKNAIIGRPLAPSLGFTATTLGSTQLANLGEISSWGTETQLNVQALDRGWLQWDVGLAFTHMGNRVDDLGSVERVPVQRGRSHAVGYPLASLLEYRVVSADFVKGNRGAVTNVMCDGGTGPQGPIMRAGGPPVPCSEAPRVFWGQGEPTWIVGLSSSVTLFQNLLLSAHVDAKGGHWMSSDYLGARHTGFQSSPLVFLQDNPIGMGYLQVSRNGLTYHKAGFAKLREVSVRYTIPTPLADRMGASRASINLGIRNPLTLWREQVYQERERIIDPEMNRPDENFGGESGGGWPPLRQVLAGVSVSF